MKVIINADDFGYSHDVNLAIVEAFSRGYITNTTIMVNMPGFEEAINLAKEKDFFDRVGIHLNFFEGEPLTQKIKNIPLFMRDNKMTSYNIFHNSSILKRFYLSKSTRIALREEAKKQLTKYKEAGFSQYHLDSHGHSHTILSIYFAIYKTILNYNFRTIRKSLNLYLNRSSLVAIYKKIINYFLEKNHMTTKYFASANEYIEVMKSGFIDEDAVCEIMVHPVYEDGKLINKGSVGFEELHKYIDKECLISFNEI